MVPCVRRGSRHQRHRMGRCPHWRRPRGGGCASHARTPATTSCAAARVSRRRCGSCDPRRARRAPRRSTRAAAAQPRRRPRAGSARARAGWASTARSAASFGDGSRQSAWRICHCRRPRTSVHCSHEPRVAQHGGAPPPRVPRAAAGASRSAPRPPPRRRRRTRFLSAPTCRLGRGAASDAAAPRDARRPRAVCRRRSASRVR